MSALPALSAFNVFFTVGTIWVLWKVLQCMRSRARTTPLAGPPNPNFLLGAARSLAAAPDVGNIYEEWSEKYGPVFRVPAAMGLSRIVLCEPKAIMHHYSRDAYGYVHTTVSRRVTESMVGVFDAGHGFGGD